MSTPSPATGFVVRLALRRDRILVGVWAVVLLGLVYASAAATADLYPSVGDRVRAAQAIDRSTALVALYGPILDERSLGELAMTKLTVLYALAVAVLGMILVRRHTRAEEEDGRAELLASTVLGRATLLDGAVAWAAVVVVGAGALAAIADIAGGLPMQGSLLFGASWAGVGLVGVATTALAAQISRTARGTAGLVLGAFGAMFAIRALADVSSDGRGWGWLSPLGWTTRLQAWSEPRWWVLGLWPALAAALLGAAVLLGRRRDLGAGLFGERPGPAGGRLSGPWSLAARLQRGSLLAWTVAMVALGGLAGALAPGVGDLLDTSAGREVLRSLGGRGALEDALLGAIFTLAGVAVAGWGIAVVARGASDDEHGRSELLLATGIRRRSAAGATAATALLPPLLLLALGGLAAALVLTVGSGGGFVERWRQVMPTAVAPWPAATVVVALALVGQAWWRRGAVVGWTVLVVALVLDDLGPLLHLPDAVRALSPFHHVPPAGTLLTGAQGLLLALAAAFALAAVRRFARRDLG